MTNEAMIQQPATLMTGTTRPDTNIRRFEETVYASLPKNKRNSDNACAVRSFFEETQPQSPLEGMVYGQLYAIHSHVMVLLDDAHKALSGDTKEQYLRMANKCLKSFNASLAALGKLKNQGKQVIRVENVNVGNGGQAIVGNFEHRGGNKF